MGADHSKLRHTSSSRGKDSPSVPSIRLPPSQSFSEPSRTEDSPSREIVRSRTGSTSSRGTRNPIPLKARRLIQSCFSNPHEAIGKRATKRACEAKAEFAAFYASMDAASKEEFEDNIKLLLNKVVANIDYVDEMERLSEEFGRSLVELRIKGFRADLLSTLADAVCKECLHLDSAVHKAHTTTSAFSQLGSLVFSSVRDGFYMEIRRKRRTSNSFSSGSNGSRREKKNGERGESPRSASPSDSHDSDGGMPIPEGDDGFLKPPSASVLLSSRSF